MEKFSQFFKKNKGSIPIYMLFSFMLIYWVGVNIHLKSSLDPDAAKLMYHTIKMWEAKSLPLPNWMYVTTGEWDCTSFLAMPIYGICKDIFRAFGIANIINIGIFCSVIFILFESLDVKRVYACIVLIVLLMPYEIGMLSYANMLFCGGGQYIYKVLLPIAFVTLFHISSKRKMTFIYVGVLTSILLFLTCSSSGVYVLACGIFPVIALRTLKYFDMNEDQKKRYSIVLAILVGASVLGLFFHYKWEVNSSANFISISDIKSLSLERVLKDALQVFGLFKKDEIKVLTFSGGMFCAKLVIVSAIYILSLMHLPKLIKTVLGTAISTSKDSDLNSINDLTDTEMVMAELLAIAVMNGCILLITVSASRYHLIGTVALMVAAGISMSKINFKRGFTIISFLFLCSVSVVICLKSINNYKECCPKEVAEFILQKYYETNGGYIISLKATDWAETVRVYDPKVECITYNPDRESFLDYDVYHPEKPMELLFEKCILFCYQNDWKEYFPDGIEGYYYLDSVGNMDIYTNIE